MIFLLKIIIYFFYFFSEKKMASDSKISQSYKIKKPTCYDSIRIRGFHDDQLINGYLLVNQLANKLKEYGFVNAKRSQQYCGLGENSADITDALPNIHIECKRVESLNIIKAMEQAKNDANKGNFPTVFHRKNNQKWLVTMGIDDWILIYNEYNKRKCNNGN